MLIEEALAQNNAPAQQSPFFSLILLSVVFIMFYWLLIRPQRKKQKEHEEMVRALKTGDEVVAAGGILGEIKEIHANYLRLKVTNNTELHVQRHAVNALLPKGTLKSYNKSST